MWQVEPIGAQAAAPEPVCWLWPGYLPRGAVVVLDGDPECGKSMLTVDLAARLSRGAAWPDGAAGGRPGTAVLFPAEDLRDRVVRPRLLAAGADPARVFVFGTPDAPDGRPTLPRDLPELAALVELVRPDLVALDPLPYFLSSMATGSVVRSVLGGLAGVAGRFDTTVVLVRHLMKFAGVKALYRGLGAIGIVGAARAGLLAARDPADAGRFVLTPMKSNLGPAPAPLGYRVVGGLGAPIVEWLGPTGVTADEAARGPGRADRPGVVMAAEWLVKVLSGGEVPAAWVLAQAKEAGISERTLERAKAEVGVTCRQVRAGKERSWAWSLRGRLGEFTSLRSLPELNEEESLF